MKDPVKEFDQKHGIVDIRIEEDQIMQDDQPAHIHDDDDFDEKAQDHNSTMNLVIDKAPIK